MKNKLVLFCFFLLLNFGALGIGIVLMNNGPTSYWYQNLNKAPWTPDNWVFGAAWFSLMFCFSIYMANIVFKKVEVHKKLTFLYGIQWVLNVSWNYIFFNQQQVFLGLIVIIALWLLIGYLLFNYLRTLKFYSLLILPYLIWMTIAVSLNAYIFINN